MAERKQNAPDAPDDDAVAAYLVEDADFFSRRPEVLARLKVPHASGATVSLIEKQVEVLRGQNRALERKLVDLIEVARANDAAIERIHQLALALMQAEDLASLLADLQDVLRSRFLADEVSIVLFAPRPAGDALASPARFVGRDEPALEHFANFIKAGKPHCGRLRPPQLEFLFGDRASGIGSCALIPLGPRAELGLLAIGARSEDQFAPTLGTVYLVHIGELVATALAPRLK